MPFALVTDFRERAAPERRGRLPERSKPRMRESRQANYASGPPMFRHHLRKFNRQRSRSSQFYPYLRQCLASGAVTARVCSKPMGSAVQVTTESSASGIATHDLVSPDDIFGADSDFQPAFVLDRHGPFAACVFGHHAFATNRPDVHTISGSLLLAGGIPQTLG